MSCTAPAVAALEQAAVLEEHVHELPQHVVERLDQLLARRTGRRVGGANSHSAPRPARTRSSGSRARARAPARRPSRTSSSPNAITMSLGSASSSSCAASGPPSPASASAGSARLPTITGWTNSTATWRASERAAGVRAEREQPPAAREALGHRVAQPRDPLGLGGEEALARLGAIARERVEAGAASRSRRGPRPAPAPRASQSRERVDALAGARAHEHARARPGAPRRGWTSSLSRSKSRCGSRSILLITHELAGAEHQRVLERLVLALGDRADHHARVLADAELGRADEVADVLDHQQVELVERQLRQRRAHHVRVEVALAAEARAGVELRRPARAARASRSASKRALHVALQHADAHAVEARPARARAASSCRRPGALMRFTTVTPARSKSSRLARAIVLLASSASSTTLTFVRCIGLLHRPDLQVALQLRQLAATTRPDRARQQHGRAPAMLRSCDVPPLALRSAGRRAATRPAPPPASSAARTGSLSSATRSSSSPLMLVCGSQPTTSIRGGTGAERARERQHLDRVHAVRVERRPRPSAAELGLDHVQRAGRLAARRRVEQHAAS